MLYPILRKSSQRKLMCPDEERNCWGGSGVNIYHFFPWFYLIFQKGANMLMKLTVKLSKT